METFWQIGFVRKAILRKFVKITKANLKLK